jgi:acetyl-CoA carboxylase carboxyl transferase subunit alpha
MPDELEFEKPLLELENRIAELRASEEPLEARDEIAKLEERLARQQQRVYSSLTAWQRAQIARHPKRPHTLDLINLLLEDWVELHGDRVFGDDKAIVGGLATFDGEPVVLIGHQKGRDTRENIARNFGMPHPEGYRKSLRLMQFAAKFGKPIITFIDTPGAYPGLGAEERGQAEAIARNLREMTRLTVDRW